MDANDKRMTELIYARDEAGLRAASDRYGALCRRIAACVLSSSEDAEECFNDALLAVWNFHPAQPARVALGVYMPHHTQYCAKPPQISDLPEARRRGRAAAVCGA